MTVAWLLFGEVEAVGCIFFKSLDNISDICTKYSLDTSMDIS
jgi:hypothetical protein